MNIERVPGTMRAREIDWRRVAAAHGRHMRWAECKGAPPLLGPEIEWLVWHGLAERVAGVGPRLNERGIRIMEAALDRGEYLCEAPPAIAA